MLPVLALWLALAATPTSSPGSEVVLVLDTSCSMAVPSPTDTGRMAPPNDPERAADLGALLVQGLARGSSDQVTVIGFGSTADDDPPVARSEGGVRAFPYVPGTFFKKPLEQARGLLEASPREHRMFVFFTDGAPEDIHTPDEGPQALGLTEKSPFDTLIVGLYGSPQARAGGEQFLRPLAKQAEDLVVVARPNEIVQVFTRGFARALGSRPETGTLRPGETHVIPMSKYVVEVLVAVASSAPGGPFQASLRAPAGEVPVQSEGDNGCGPDVSMGVGPKLCAPPRRHYQTFRAGNDPEKAASWTLALPRAPGTVEYGVILRYDLLAKLTVPAQARAGEPVPIDAVLTFRGQVVDDPTLFGGDGFGAVARVGKDEVPLQQAPGGHFKGTWVPTSPSPPEGSIVGVLFHSAWMEKRAYQAVEVVGWPELQLRPTPNPVELGAWRGERGVTRRCATLDLSRSNGADRLPVTCAAEGAPPGLRLSCEPVSGSEAKGPGGQPLQWQVCAEAERCCTELDSTPATQVKLAGKDPHYVGVQAAVPVRFQVEATGFWRCWWPLFAALGALLFGLWFIAGWVRPYNFDAATCLRVSGSEPGLKRASALVLREQPGGVRGFYRHARTCLNGVGDFLRRPQESVFVLEAGPAYSTVLRKAGGLEKKSRTGQWEPVPEAEWSQGLVPNATYRLGSLFLKLS